ncbi:MAG: alpha/beta hydrolase [Luminiphilus sp.]|nr:alpha/beta hydrolase [Luminiphilus sp.]
MSDPEIGTFVETCGYRTNVHDQGQGKPVVLLHGSGAGVSAWANWRNLIPKLSDRYRVLAPDLAGFGYTEIPDTFEFEFMATWIEQIEALLDALDVKSAHWVGNSFGGALTLWMAAHRPDLCDRLVLMGPGGWPTKVNENLKALWSYKPSVENMRQLMDIMAFDRALVTDELAELRYRATIRAGAQERFERIFPPPHQRWLDAQSLSIEALQSIANEVLIIHGRDDRVVDPQSSWHLHQHLLHSQLHYIGRCGHWTQIEHPARFQLLVQNFLDEES